ncbi:chitin synthase III catalytic subunit [Infundibulicybe gibba]|nr:chitin synthase III catalytic subunit [Infundibulicybe gibba]
MTQFGDFETLCHQTPSYPWCNLFYRQVSSKSCTRCATTNSSIAPVGINPECGIPRAGQDGSLANIANILACALSICFVAALIYLTNRRKAALDGSNFIISTGSLLEQGSTALVVLTAVHAGVVAALFWALLANAVVATQVVEDGTLSSLVPYYGLTLAFLAATTYIALDVAFTFTNALGPSNPPEALRSIPLFVLTTIWPCFTVVVYLGLMLYIVRAVLNETRPIWFYILSGALFVLSQLAYFLLSKVVCKGSSSKVDGSFIATILESAAVGVLYLAWRSITEESWDEDAYYPS